MLDTTSRSDRPRSTFRLSLLAAALASTLSSQAYAEIGDPTGPDIPVFRTDDPGNPNFHSLHTTARGGFLVVYIIDSPKGRHLVGQRYSRFGKVAGSPVTLFEGTDAQIAMDAKGNVTLLYAPLSSTTSNSTLRARLFDQNLTRRRDISLTVPVTEHAIDAIGRGGFVVAYTRASSPGAAEHVYARRFDINGNTRGGTIR